MVVWVLKDSFYIWIRQTHVPRSVKIESRGVLGLVFFLDIACSILQVCFDKHIMMEQCPYHKLCQIRTLLGHRERERETDSWIPQKGWQPVYNCPGGGSNTDGCGGSATHHCRGASSLRVPWPGRYGGRRGGPRGGQPGCGPTLHSGMCSVVHPPTSIARLSLLMEALVVKQRQNEGEMETEVEAGGSTLTF